MLVNMYNDRFGKDNSILAMNTDFKNQIKVSRGEV